MQKVDPKVTNTTALAYLGDAVYEVYVRKYVLEHGPGRADIMNRRAVRFVCADGQAKAARSMMEHGFLSEEEEKLLKRARNHTQTPKPRGTTPIDYKLATGLEALIGFLYLAGQEERLEEVVSEAMRIIKEKS
jgi:ribonuclease-3 family protein